jgi:hypothetical protein
MDSATAVERSRWTGFDRILLIALLLAYVPGYPGLGIDTREAANAALGVAYGLANLAPFLGLGASWRWPRIAAWLALAGGLAAVALGLLDLAGLLAGPAPTAMIVVDAVVAVLGAALAWRSFGLLRVEPIR